VVSDDPSNSGKDEAKMVGVSRGVLLLFLIAAGVVRAHVHYVSAIPNALNLEDIAAVGHEDVKGGGPRNKFGDDFAMIGEHEWTRALCEADSDGDGESNGVFYFSHAFFLSCSRIFASLFLRFSGLRRCEVADGAGLSWFLVLLASS
jgi:hypothetical protein